MKPMTEKQRKAIWGIENILDISYKGNDTAQEAFFFLREHLPTAQEQVNRMIQNSAIYQTGNDNRFIPNKSIMDQMFFYRFDNSNNLSDPEDDDSFAETPTLESLDADLAFLYRLI
ncbi:hypothetical protein [Paenibacillus chitinolyticus]|uniref:hypothetical protein n=1 Tax=Paenibacillus chitinolyticus TaxID=79263 RepID=UPI00366A8C04